MYRECDVMTERETDKVFCLLNNRGTQLRFGVSAIIASFSLIYIYIGGIPDFYWDSGYYWTIGQAILSGGITAFPATFRGYLLPTIYAYVGALLDYKGYAIWISCLTSVCVCVSLPNLLDIQINSKKAVVRLVGVLALLAAFGWGELMRYPLSDLPAMCFCMSGASLLKWADRAGTWMAREIFLLFSGVFLYAAYNTRALYLYAAILLVAFFTFFSQNAWLKDRRKTLILSKAAALLLGVMIVALPQMLINHEHIGKYSPEVPTESYADGQSLQNMQLHWGVGISYYSSYVGPSEIYPQGGLLYLDPSGQTIVNREAIPPEQFDLAALFRLFLKYPLDMIAIYTRHLVSAFTIFYSQTYIDDIFRPKGLLILGSILLWYVFFTNIILAAKNGWRNAVVQKTDEIIPLLLISLPCFIQVVGAFETRFFIAPYFILYFYICLVVDWKVLVEHVKRARPEHVMLALIIFALWISVAGTVLSQLHEEVQLIHDQSRISTSTQLTQN